MKDVNCPYCGTGQEINHDDGYGFEEGKSHRQECAECDKTFVFTTLVDYYYDARKADCLNGKEHKWKETATFPHCFRRLRCSVCDEEKEIEGIEKEREEYIDSLRRK